MNDMAKNVLVWLVIGLVLMTVFQSLSQRTGSTPELTYSEFLREVRGDNVSRVTIAEDRMSISGEKRDGTTFRTNAPFDPKLIDDVVTIMSDCWWSM